MEIRLPIVSLQAIRAWVLAFAAGFAGGYGAAVYPPMAAQPSASSLAVVAGTGVTGFSGDGGPATRARLSEYVPGIAVDPRGTLYLADMYNHRIRKVSLDGTIETIAGTGERGYCGDGGPARRAQLNFPTGVAFDRDGQLYVADLGNHRIRRVARDGTIGTVVGNGIKGVSDDGVRAIEARLSAPSWVGVDPEGRLLVAERGSHRIREVDGGVLRTRYSGLPYVFGLMIDPGGVLYLSDSVGQRIYRIDRHGSVSVAAGTGDGGYGGDGGPAEKARLFYPRGLLVDRSGALFIADSLNRRIRRVALDGTITTIAGGTGGHDDIASPSGNGSETWPELDEPVALALDSEGNLYIADVAQKRVFKCVIHKPDKVTQGSYGS